MNKLCNKSFTRGTFITVDMGSFTFCKQLLPTSTVENVEFVKNNYTICTVLIVNYLPYNLGSMRYRLELGFVYETVYSSNEARSKMD